MKIENKIISLNTKKRFEVIDITEKVEDFVKDTSEGNGQVLVYSKHTTLAIVVNEKESGIFKDAKEFFEKNIPQHHYYHHNDMNIRTENLVCDADSECLNGDSHIQHLILGASETLPVEGGKIVFGPWQKIMAIELDGSRDNRQIYLQYLGE